jgi:hypothetical protein
LQNLLAKPPSISADACLEVGKVRADVGCAQAEVAMDRERHLESKVREDVEKHLKACEVRKPKVDSMVREAKRAHVGNCARAPAA